MKKSWSKWLLPLLLLFLLGWFWQQRNPLPQSSSNTEKSELSELQKRNPEVPVYALEVLQYIRTHDNAPEGYQGGRRFMNRERNLPQQSANGQRITYREWDVRPLRKGKNRGAERLVTAEEAAYYTRDHYQSFTRINE